MIANSVGRVCKYTKIQMRVILGLGGIWLRIVGINAANANTSVAIAAIRSLKLLSWNRIPKFSTSKKNNGMKIVIRADKGNLYKGMLKQAQWKAQILAYFYLKSMTKGLLQLSLMLIQLVLSKSLGLIPYFLSSMVYLILPIIYSLLLCLSAQIFFFF